MAAEAINSIKEAEAKGADMIRDAQEKAKKILKDAEIKGGEKQKESMQEARKIRDDLIAKAETEAKNVSAPLLEANKEEIAKILNPDAPKLKSAVNAVVERIVKMNGNS